MDVMDEMNEFHEVFRTHKKMVNNKKKKSYEKHLFFMKCMRLVL